MAKCGQERPLRQITPFKRLAEQTCEWFAAAQRHSYERTRIVTGLKFMLPLSAVEGMAAPDVSNAFA